MQSALSLGHVRVLILSALSCLQGKRRLSSFSAAYQRHIFVFGEDNEISGRILFSFNCY